MLEIKTTDKLVDKLYFLMDLKLELKDEWAIQWEVEINDNIITIYRNQNETDQMFVVVTKEWEEVKFYLEWLIANFYNILFPNQETDD